MSVGIGLFAGYMYRTPFSFMAFASLLIFLVLGTTSIIPNVTRGGAPFILAAFVLLLLGGACGVGLLWASRFYPFDRAVTHQHARTDR
jgi:hypothetical protein